MKTRTTKSKHQQQVKRPLIDPSRKLDYIPEILYEAPSYAGGSTSPIPYIEIPKDKDMPSGLFILEYKCTGEQEMGPRGIPEEIMDGPYSHMYVDFNIVTKCIANGFPHLDMNQVIDTLRTELGLKPLKKAKQDGEAMMQRLVERVSANLVQYSSTSSDSSVLLSPLKYPEGHSSNQ